MSYQLNTEGAKQANAKQAGYINKNGEYLLKIERAFWVNGSDGKQSRGLTLDLIDAQKQKATISLWFQKADGNRNEQAANMLDGIMLALGLTNLSEKPESYEEYDRLAECNVVRNVSGCPELKGRGLNVLIQMETDAYQKNGETKTIDKATIFAVYQHKTNLTPLEIATNITVAKEFELLKEKLANAKPRFSKKYRELVGNGAQPQQDNNQPSQELDDDLPW